MKLLSFYNETFSDGLEYVNAIWNVAKQDNSINGLYLCLPQYLTEGYLGVSNPTLTWYNMLADGNYLYGTGFTRIASSGQFNNKPCIQFKDDGTTSLRYKKPVSVGTVIMVYLIRQTGSYIIYAPRATTTSPPIYYDAFPPAGSNLWAYESFTQGSIYNASSKINGKNVAPNTFLPLNSARILSVKNIANLDAKESITGYGGQFGTVGGSESFQGGNNSLKGSLAAIITYENNISDDLLRDIEVVLAEQYISYAGIVQASYPSLKYLVNTPINYDFASVFVDEWFDLVSYEVVYPTDKGLSFLASTLVGNPGVIYEGDVVIGITNAGGMYKEFSIPLEICRADPIIGSFPALTSLMCVLSANKHNDGGYYGIKKDALNQIISWEDARRVHPTLTLPKYNQVENKLAQYLPITSTFNNQSTVQFSNNSRLAGGGVSGKTFVWVYSQDSYGNRNMLDTFPDIKGTGVLWTISTLSETHGSTPVTKLTTKVQRIPINTLNFKVPLNTTYIITATTPDNNVLTYTALDNLRGKLAFLAVWNTVLTDDQLNTVVSALAIRYANSLAPYVFNTNTEYRNQIDVTIDLTRKVSDLRNQALTYDLLTSIYDASIDSDGLLTVTAEKDELLTFEIDVTNTDNLTSRLTFNVDVIVRPNPLYINLRTVLGSDVNTIFLTDTDTLTLDGVRITEWEDYRLNNYIGIGHDLELVSLPQLDNKYAADFSILGESYLELPVAAEGKCFGLAYIRKDNAVSRAFLMGQTNSAEFISGIDGRLWDTTTSPKILNASTYINGRQVENTYSITPQVLNTIFINTTDLVTINSIAKDRVFNDSSVKGYIPLWFISNRAVTEAEALLLNKYIRDYYDPIRFITLLHFDTVNADSSVENKVLTSTITLSTSTKKFGTSSGMLISNSNVRYIEIPNDIDYAYLLEDFSISFWLHINKTLDTNDTFSIYSQTDLLVYIKGDKLCVGRSYISDLALMTYTITAEFLNTFNHIALVRQDKTLRLYINGTSVGIVIDDTEYKDYNTLVRIGQRTNITTTNLTMYIDELAVYKREALHMGNTFDVPTSAYT